MSSVVIAGNTSGTITLDAPAVAGTTTLNLPATTGTLAINGPAFSAYMGSTQSIANATFTKLQFNAKTFDTNTNYDAVTNYRFTPTVAGYYQVNGGCRINQPVGGGEVFLDIYKNGSELVRGSDNYIASTGGFIMPTISFLVQMNGSTDYLELYAYQASGSTQSTSNAGAALTYFQASMVRSA